MAAKSLRRAGRVSIRRFRRSDLKERIRWPPYTSPLYRHLNYPLSTFIERERWLFTRITNAGRMYFAVEDEHCALIGEISLREINARARTSRLGIHLVSHKRGCGYGREALEAFLDHYFQDMRYEIMFLDVAAYNMRALRLYESLCFEHIGSFWRIENSDTPIFTDERFADIREHFRKDRGLTECRFLDMRLSRRDYQRQMLERRRAALARERKAD